MGALPEQRLGGWRLPARVYRGQEAWAKKAELGDEVLRLEEAAGGPSSVLPQRQKDTNRGWGYLRHQNGMDTKMGRHTWQVFSFERTS